MDQCINAETAAYRLFTGIEGSHDVDRVERARDSEGPCPQIAEEACTLTYAMKVLKAHAIDFARQIDELRCLLVTHHDTSPVLKKEPKWQRRKK